MLLPLVIGLILLFCSLLAYGLAMHLSVLAAARLLRGRTKVLGFWRSTTVMSIAMLIAAAAHLAQIALWAAAFLFLGQISTLEMAFYFSAENYTALGYGDIQLSEEWRLLGPLEAVNGLLFFGLSTAVLFAILSRLIANRLHADAA